jgi:hypothetical protein
MSIVVSTLSISSEIHETLCKYYSANLDTTHFCPVSNVPGYLTLPFCLRRMHSSCGQEVEVFKETIEYYDPQCIKT